MKTLFRAVLALVALSLCCAVAQEKPAAKGKPAAKPAQKQAPAGVQEMTFQPASEMKKVLSAFTGTWKAEEKHEAMEGMPAGTSTGTTVFRPGPGKLSLVQDYKSNMEGTPFTGLGLLWFDPATKTFTSMWCDSMTPSGCAIGGTGKWVGNDLVFNGEMEMNGKKHKTKETFTNIKPDSITFNVEMDGKPNMSIVYTKAAKT